LGPACDARPGEARPSPVLRASGWTGRGAVQTVQRFARSARCLPRISRLRSSVATSLSKLKESYPFQEVRSVQLGAKQAVSFRTAQESPPLRHQLQLQLQ